MRPLTVFMLATLAFAAATNTFAAERNYNAEVDKALAVAKKWPGVIRSNIGVTRLGTKIPCLLTQEGLDLKSSKVRVLVISGLDGSAASTAATMELLEWFHASKEGRKLHDVIEIAAVPIANPDGWASGTGPGNLSKGFPARNYPPKGNAYNSKTDPEAAYLWRWIGLHAPEQVWVIGERKDSALMAALRKHRPAGIGLVTTISMSFSDIRLGEKERLKSQVLFARKMLAATARLHREYENALRGNRDGGKRKNASIPPHLKTSSARAEMIRRINRSPIEIARQLGKRYGHRLGNVAYIPALALIGRLRLGELTNDPSHRQDVEKIVAPYFTGKKPTFGKRVSGSMMPGHLVFGELARTETDPANKARYIALARRAADLGFDENGKMKRSMPAHSEMSDAVFMGCPILTQVGKLTGETKYYDMAFRHMRFMLKLNLREDGLHRHSPLNETAWGRGNGFPALGLVLCLSDLPEDYSGRAEMLAAFRAHMAAMARHQDPTGMWHQVVDHDESYRELTVTCMTTFAMIRGIRKGWLDEKTYGPIVRRAFTALTTRIAPDATLVDVCTGTGKQRSLRAYFDRTAILGHDDRGGAMSLLVTTEMARWQQERAK